MEAPFIRIEGVSKTFDGSFAVHEVSLDIRRGELFSLLGPSGCGKTTLLRMIAGFENPDRGRILIDGADMTGKPPYERPVNMMFQSYALFPHMSVRQNVAFGLRQDGCPKAEIRERVAAILDVVQMGGFAGRKPHQLSGGQRQRVALARALVKEPKVLLLDEPLAALDKKLREETQFELVGLQERLGVTFVMVTHDQDEAMAMSSRICVMNAGRIEQVGSPLELYETPSSRWVAGFVGSANLFEGHVAETGGEGIVVRCPDLGLDLAVAQAAPIPLGAAVAVMVRPEKLEVNPRRPVEGTANILAGRVRDIAYFGDLSVYHVRLESGALVQASRANRRHTAGPLLAREDEAWLSFHPADAVVLPP